MKILVVDDEEDVRFLFEQRFRREIRSGLFNFSFAYSGEEALAYLQDHAVVLILSDINMPGMSGLDLLRHINQERPVPPPPPMVMMITAYGDKESYDQALSLGAKALLTKPVDFPALKERLLALGGAQQPSAS
jgi:CheY-like chemotaxis protein